MDRRLLLPLMFVLGCAQGSLEGPGSFGLPNTATMTTQADTEDEDDDDGETEDTEDDGDGDGDGDTGPSTQSSTDPSTADDDGSTSAPVTTAEDSSEADDGASLDDSASASAEESSSTEPIDPTDATNDDGVNDDGPMPPPDGGPWDNCEAAVCEVGTDCITVNGVAGEAFCSPQCATDLDCPFPDSGDATPMCLLIGEGAVDPTNCTLVCEVDGFDYGTCPNGMTCTSVPGQDPTISLCMW